MHDSCIIRYPLCGLSGGVGQGARMSLDRHVVVKVNAVDHIQREKKDECRKELAKQ